MSHQQTCQSFQCSGERCYQDEAHANRTTTCHNETYCEVWSCKGAAGGKAIPLSQNPQFSAESASISHLPSLSESLSVIFALLWQHFSTLILSFDCLLQLYRFSSTNYTARCSSGCGAEPCRTNGSTSRQQCALECCAGPLCLQLNASAYGMGPALFCSRAGRWVGRIVAASLHLCISCVLGAG